MPVTVDFIHSQETQVYLVIKAVFKGLGVAAAAMTKSGVLSFGSQVKGPLASMCSVSPFETHFFSPRGGWRINLGPID